MREKILKERLSQQKEEKEKTPDNMLKYMKCANESRCDIYSLVLNVLNMRMIKDTAKKSYRRVYVAIVSADFFSYGFAVTTSCCLLQPFSHYHHGRHLDKSGYFFFFLLVK